MKHFVWLTVVAVGLSGSAWADTVGYFKFDNIQNNQFTDDTGYGLLGTLGISAGAGAPEHIEGPGGDQAILIPAGEGLVADDSQFFVLDEFAPRTVEMWIKADEFALSESFAAIYSYGQDAGYRLQLNQDHTLSYALMGVTTYDTGVTFPFDGEWHHLAVVEDYDNATISLYLDGESVYSTDEYADNNLSDNSLLFIGRTGLTPNFLAFEGAIDRLRFTAAALTPEEFDSDPANTKAIDDTTMAFFDFNEESLPYFSESNSESLSVQTIKDYTSGGAGAPEISTDTPSGAEGDFSLYFADGAQASVRDPQRVLDVGGEGNNWTLEAWMKYPDGNFTGRQMLYYYGPGAYSFSLSGANPRLLFTTTLRIADFPSQNAAIFPDEWHHGAVVHRDGETLSFYVNGELIDELEYTGGSHLTDVPSLHIGSEPNGVLPFNGWIDRVRISNVALSAEELDSDPNAPTGVDDWSIF